MVIATTQGINFTQLTPEAVADLTARYLSTSLALQALIINIVVLPIIIWVLLKSGNWERQMIIEELAGEVGTVITPEEYEGVKAEKRFKLRKLLAYSGRIGRDIRNAQNSLAFHKAYLKRRSRPVEADPLAAYFRAEIVRLRGD